MKDFLSQIKISIDNNLYYLALYSTLSLPDICGALSSSDGQATKSRYIDWYNKYALGKCSSTLNGLGCYKFRCSSLHQGNTQHESLPYSRVLFIEPAATNGNVLHDNNIMGALNIDLRRFCYGMLDAVNEWLSEVETDPVFQNNYSKFMKRYPTGLPPYIVGIPIIT